MDPIQALNLDSTNKVSELSQSLRSTTSEDVKKIQKDQEGTGTSTAFKISLEGKMMAHTAQALSKLSDIRPAVEPRIVEIQNRIKEGSYPDQKAIYGAAEKLVNNMYKPETNNINNVLGDGTGSKIK